MNQTEQVLLQAIQKSIWGADIVLPSDTDWKSVLKEAEDQAVLGLVIGAAPEDVRAEWNGKASAVTATFIRILHYQEQLYGLFRANGIPMVILKGMAAAMYYPNPSQRSMGDIDFLVHIEDIERAKALLSENGYEVEDDPRHIRHMHVYKDGILFELHRQFSGEVVDVERYVIEGMTAIETGRVLGSEFPMLPKLANGLVLLGHMVQHLRSGLGLRQVIDWMMYVHSALSDAFWTEQFQKVAKDVGLEKTAITATQMCRMYLGLPDRIDWCDSADPKLCEELMESLLSSGNFDRKRGAGSKVESVTANLSRKGVFQYLQEAGEYNWKAYHRHKWLKPFAWIYQIGRYAKKGLMSGRSGRLLKDDVDRGRRRTALLKKLGIGK